MHHLFVLGTYLYHIRQRVHLAEYSGCDGARYQIATKDQQGLKVILKSFCGSDPVL